jgi:S-adenosylmethionine synthetase
MPTMSQLHVNELATGAQAVEMVERKGLGHPDTICDAIAERLSCALSHHYLNLFGNILHHNVDKVLLSAGSSRADFGGGELLQPIHLFLGGRATSHMGGLAVPVEEIAIETTRSWFSQFFPQLNLAKDLRIHCQIHPGSRDLVQLFERGRAPLANDSSFAVGYAPLSALERLILDAEARLNSPEYRALQRSAGLDVKVTGVRRGSEISLTIARAFIGGELSTLSDYLEAKAATARFLEQFARERGLSAHVVVNAADEPDDGSVYLTVLGTSAESGDDGQVGRGNRANGLITPHRPMSLEAIAGKNPISHVGKLYNVLAREVAENLVSSLEQVTAARCYLASEIGRPIDEPGLVHVELETRDGLPALALARPVEELVRAHLGALAGLSERIVEGEVPLF